MVQKNDRSNPENVGFGNVDTFEKTFKLQESQGSNARDLVYPGKNPRDMLMRTVFRSDRQANAFTLAMAQMEEFDDTEGQNILLNDMAARCSVDGRGQQNLLQALTGYYDYVRSQSIGKYKEPKRDDNEYRKVGPGD